MSQCVRRGENSYVNKVPLQRLAKRSNPQPADDTCSFLYYLRVKTSANRCIDTLSTSWSVSRHSLLCYDISESLNYQFGSIIPFVKGVAHQFSGFLAEKVRCPESHNVTLS